MDANSLDPASYKLLEPKQLDRHMKAFLRMAKVKETDELSPRGFKPKSQFFRREANPLDKASSVPLQPEFDKKLKSFYKVPKRKFSITRPIDSKETFIASGGPSVHIVSARAVARAKFLLPTNKLSKIIRQTDFPSMSATKTFDSLQDCVHSAGEHKSHAKDTSQRRVHSQVPVRKHYSSTTRNSPYASTRIVLKAEEIQEYEDR